MNVSLNLRSCADYQFRIFINFILVLSINFKLIFKISLKLNMTIKKFLDLVTVKSNSHDETIVNAK